MLLLSLLLLTLSPSLSLQRQAGKRAEQPALHPDLVHCGGLCVQDVCWGCSQGQHLIGREQQGSGLSRLRGMAL